MVLVSDKDCGNRHALVLYGSETGDAQSAAEELVQLVRRLHCKCDILELDAVEPSELNRYDLTLVAISTTGQGDLPRNAQTFWRRLLRKKLPSSHLSETNFALIGLGDSSYPKFNYAARKLHKRLVQLGAQELGEKGEADQQHPEGSDSIFLPWKDTLRRKLLELYPLTPGVEPIPESQLLEPPWLLTLVQDDQDQTDDSLRFQSHHERGKLNPSSSVGVTLKVNKRITPDGHWQDVRHLVFDANKVQPYAPGDILMIQPKNPPDDVQQLIEAMGWSSVADRNVILTANEACIATATGARPHLHPLSAVTRLPLRTMLSECCDLNAIPKRAFFSLMTHFTDDEFQKSRLIEFADPDLTDELFDYTTRPRRSILEVLQEFDTIKIPWQWTLEVFPPLRGRQFSIASGGALKETTDGHARFELLVAIVKYRTVIRKVRRGVCTRYLGGLQPGAMLNVELIKGSLNITKANADLPLLMIGPGTGVAPMRSLAWERARWAKEGANAAPSALGPSILLFGCRNERADYFFREEWTQIREEAALEVHAAFSRDQQKKFYVQDLIRQIGSEIVEMLHGSKGFVCVCGSSGKMPDAVRDALVDVFQKGLNWERSEAEAYLHTMEKESRYKQETW